jgi:Uncharacterised nucleotidyltransferase
MSPPDDWPGIYTGSADKASVQVNVANLDEGTNQAARVAGVAARMRLDAATNQVLEVFAGLGVRATLLKGVSLVGWLYPADSAHYSDADVLIHPADEERAMEGLRTIGFTQDMDDRGMPEWWREHASEWHRATDGVAVDLHRRIVGIGIAPEAAWPLLTADAHTAPVGGGAVPVLAPSARLMHVVLHAAQHGGEGAGGKAILHMERALELLDDDLWAAAAALAAQLDATDAFAAGLRLTPAGTERADRLALPAVASVDAALRATTPPDVALGFEQLARASDWRARVEIGARKLFPPREFLIHWDPRAASGRGAYLRARLRRPLWVLRNAPAGFRAWWRARRAVRR